MSIGNPVTYSGSDEITVTGIRPITFSRQDSSSFKEELLQDIVDKSPEVLPIRDFYPAITSVCSLGREIPLDLGERQGFIDNLLVTNDGHLVIVETKLYRNPEAVRDAVVQTLEYGMAVHKMSLLDLESRIRRGDQRGKRLQNDETIRSRAASLMGFSDEFEIALERYQRTGEILLLIVADGIRTSVERITQWMNDNGSSTPIKFGLVELRFYELPDGQKIVIPRTLLQTKEISRHVVVVDIQNETAAKVSAVVQDKFNKPNGGASSKSRTVKSSTPSITSESLLASLTADTAPVAQELLTQIASIGLDENTKGGWSLRYGITYPQDGGEFIPLIYLSKGGVNAYFPKRMTELLGSGAIGEFRLRLRQAAQFWTDEQMSDPYTNGSIVRYDQLRGKIKDVIDVLEDFKVRAINALSNELVLSD
ncbi:MAG: hypothetical protein WDM70_11280 [Nitrosomonadales bacterium]